MRYEKWYCPFTQEMHILDADNPPDICSSCGNRHILGTYLNGEGVQAYRQRNWWYKKQYLESPKNERKKR